MNVGSLFSGIGGIEVGFHEEGFQTLWFVENDEYAASILRSRFPEAEVYEDVTTLDFSRVPPIDVLTGGFPCQDISNAGKRAGIEGSRSSLWSHYARAIGVLRPRYALVENVSALTGRGLNVVLRDLASLGYDAEWHCVPASAVGAHHRRNRIFIVASQSQRSDSDCERSYRQGEQQQGASELRDEQDCIVEGLGKASHSPRGVWAVEPGVGRVADGIPDRVDRIRCLGNAVVPQVARVFARAIKEDGSR